MIRVPARIAAVLLVGSVCGSCRHNSGRVVLTNAATEPISRVVVVVCDQTIEGKDLRPNDVWNGSFTIKCEGDYDATVQFRSGKQMHQKVGYVTGGFDTSAHLIVDSNQILVDKEHTQFK